MSYFQQNGQSQGSMYQNPAMVTGMKVPGNSSSRINTSKMEGYDISRGNIRKTPNWVGKSSLKNAPEQNRHSSQNGMGSHMTRSALPPYDPNNMNSKKYKLKKEPQTMKNIENNYSQTMSQYRQKAVAELQEEYTKTLQEDVKIQEYELKIMKDKEMEKLQNNTQIDKFFSDGIPQNENILALKTQYKTKMSDVETQMTHLNGQKSNEYNKNYDFCDQIKKFMTAIDYVCDTHDTTDKHNFDLKKALTIENTGERFIKEELDFKTKKVTDDLKRLWDENLQMNRDIEQEKFANRHKDDPTIELKNRDLNLKKFQKQLRELELECECTKNGVKVEGNHEFNKIQNANREKEMKLTMNLKKVHMLDAKIQESNMLMEVQGKDRDHENDVCRKFKKQVQDLRHEIQIEKHATETVIAMRVEEKKNQEITEAIRCLEQEERLRSLLKRRHDDWERDYIQLGAKKEFLVNEAFDAEKQSERLDKELFDQKKLFERLRKDHDFHKNHLKDVMDEEPMVDEDLQRLSSIPPAQKNDIKKHKNALAIEEKKIRFAREVQAFNSEDLNILSHTNVNMKDNIAQFMQKYDDIRTLNNIYGGDDNKGKAGLLNSDLRSQQVQDDQNYRAEYENANPQEMPWLFSKFSEQQPDWQKRDQVHPGFPKM